jgi:hypothetical protein
MPQYLSEEMIERLYVEVTAQRLIIRSLLAYIAVTSSRPLSQLITDLQDAAEKTSPDIVPLPDVERGIHEKASALAKERAAQFINDLGPLTLGTKQPGIQPT